MSARPLDRPGNAPAHARFSNDPAVLASILDPGVTLAVWDRPCPFEITTLESFDDVRFTSASRDVATALDAAISCDQPQPWYDLLVRDVASLAARFADIMGVDWLEVRLERVTGNACWKFHADYVTARLITTYLGDGTQWLDQRDAALVKPRLIRQLRAGATGLFKGREWAFESAIVHRSPPIAGTGAERLLLVINPSRERVRKPSR